MPIKPEIILASSSKSRLNLLKQIGIFPDKIISPDINEERKPKEKPQIMAARLAKSKTKNISLQHPNSIVIGGDTVSYCAGKILDKTYDPDVARTYLKLISGRRHSLYSSVCVALESENIFRQKTVKSILQFKRFSETEIDEYIASKQWEGCSGAYKTEGIIARYLKFISGSTSCIMGMPLHETYQLLNSLGYKIFTAENGEH